jgi:hypothetical protein
LNMGEHNHHRAGILTQSPLRSLRPLSASSVFLF